MTPADRQRLDRERKIRMDMHAIKYPEKCLTKGKQNISIYKYMWLVSLIFQIISTTAIVYLAMFVYSYHRIYF